MRQTVINKIMRRIRGKGRGAVFVPQDFLDLGSRTAVDKTLSRLAQGGQIRRICRGIYDYPRHNPRLHLDLPPTSHAVASAAVKRTNSRLQISGALAANQFQLSTQVPAQDVYLTDGPSKRIVLGRRVIELRHIARKHMAGVGRISGAVFQALRYLGSAHIDDGVIQKPRHTLSPTDKKFLQRDMASSPAWIRLYVAQIIA